LSAGRVGFISASFQDSSVTGDLVLLLLDDESKCGHLFRAGIRADKGIDNRARQLKYPEAH
jgi:hypothetical protein